MAEVGLSVRTDKASAGRSRWRHWFVLAVCLVLPAAPSLAVPGGSQGLNLLTRTFEGLPRDVALDGSLAYVGLDSGLAVVDVSNPSAPDFVGHLYLASPALSVSVSGALVFVANGESGLSIVDVSNPAEPFLVTTYAVGDARDLALVGDRVYVALVEGSAPGTRNGLSIVDASDLGALNELGFAETTNGALSVSVSGSRVLLGVGASLSKSHGIVVLDTTDAMSPFQIGWLATGEPVNDIHDDGSLVYLATGTTLSGHLRSVDMSSPSFPVERCRTPVGDSALGLVVIADVAYVASRSLGLKSFDVTHPDTLLALDTLPTGREAWSVAANGSLAFLCERSSAGMAGFTVVSTPTWPIKLAEMATLPFAEVNDVAVLPDAAFILRRDALHVLDDKLEVVGSWDPSRADLSALAVRSGLAAVADGDTIHLLDLTDLGAPTQRAMFSLTGGVAVSLELDGDVLFVVDGTGLQTFDIGVPSSPASLGSYWSSGLTAAVAIEGRYAYLAAGSSLEILDIGNPALPVMVAQVPLPGHAYGVAVDDGLVVLCGLGYSAMVVDAGDPMSPVLRGSLPGTDSFDIALTADHAVVAAGNGGTLLVGVGDPTNPIIEGWHETSGRTVAVAVAHDGTTHVAGESTQHWVLDCQACVAACSMDAQLVVDPGPFCQGEVVLLSAASSDFGDCPEGDERIAWFEDDVFMPGWEGDTHLVAEDHPDGTFDFSVELTCISNPACFDDQSVTVTIQPGTMPTIDPSSLRLLKLAGDEEEYVSWVITSGSGTSNLHRSMDPADLSGEARDMSSLLVGVTDDGVLHDASFGPGSLACFRVYPANSCSGQSVYPSP